MDTNCEEASSPYQFISACMELIKAIEVGEDYVTGLPLSVDASKSSGYQDYRSNLLRSQKDARLQIIFIMTKPSYLANDIYTDVAKYVTIDCKNTCRWTLMRIRKVHA